MIRIPTPRVANQAFQNPGLAAPIPTVDLQRPPDEFSHQQVASAIGSVAVVIAEDAEREENELRAARLREVSATSEEEDRNALDAYRMLEGKNAVDALKGLLDGYDDRTRTTADGLPQEVRQLYLNNRQDKRRAFAESAMTHRRSEAKEFMATQSEAYLGNLIKAWVSQVSDHHQGRQDPETKEKADVKARAAAIKQANEVADWQGLGDEARKQLVLGITTKAHRDIIERMVAEDYGPRATDYLEKWQEEIAPAEVTRLKGVIRRKGVANESTVLSMQIEQFLNAKGVSRNDWMETARGMVDSKFESGDLSAEARDATLYRLRDAYQREGQRAAAFANGLVQQAEEFLRGNPNASIEDLPAKLYDDLQSRGLMGGLRKFSEEKRWGTTQLGRRLKLNFLANPGALLRIGSVDELIDGLRPHMSNDDLEKMAEQWRNVRGIATSAEAAKIEPDKLMMQAARRFGILPQDDKPDPEQLNRYEDFELEVRQKVNANVLGRTATIDDYEKAIQQIGANRIRIDGEERVLATVTAEEQATGYYQLPSGRVVYDKNIGPQVKRQILEAIRIYNQRAEQLIRAGDVTVKPKPSTMLQIAIEWDKLDRKRNGGQNRYKQPPSPFGVIPDAAVPDVGRQDFVWQLSEGGK